MPECRSSNSAPPRGDVGCRRRDGLLLGFGWGLALYTLVRCGEALAGEQGGVANLRLDPAIVNFVPISPAAAPLLQAPDFALPTAGGIPVYSTTEFRPRKRSMMDGDPVASAFSDAPVIRSTTVWQRLSDYKSHDRVQVLTLWETSGSSISLQAGKRGDPSLQWTSRLMNRGGSTQGLLDRLFSVSIAGAANGLRNASRSTSAQASPKPMIGSAAVTAAAK